MMRVFIIAALSADGYIARQPHELVDWSSKEDKQWFAKLTKEAGTVIMGSNTFKTIGKGLPDRRTIVYSRSPDLLTNEQSQSGVEATQEAPEALLKRLEQEGVKAVAICGGAMVYDLFLRTNLITELYLTTEPLLFGTGIRLCYEPMDIRLRLLERHELNVTGSTLSHYEVAG
jgi:dihydrofolate reductase